MTEHRRGFTLIELMMVIALSVIVLTPAYRIFKGSSQASLQGMHQIEMVQEGRRIIHQIHNDLKLACKDFSKQAVEHRFTDILPPGQPADPNRYSFLSFPQHGEVSDAVSNKVPSGQAPRYVNRITYYLEPSGTGGNPFSKLIREEVVHPALPGASTGRKVLSERVNFFSIRPVEIQNKVGTNQWFYNVTLQLGEVRNPNIVKGTQGPVPAKMAGVMISDFFDVVYPEFFAALNNQEFMGRNWYTSIDGPP